MRERVVWSDGSVMEAIVVRGRKDGMPTRAAVFVAQLPPPVHGQAVADAELARTQADRLDLRVVPMRFAADVDDIGRFRLGKLWAAARVLGGALRARRTSRADTLVWSLGARSRLPVLRDAVLLSLLRPWFERTILHLHTGDYGDRIAHERGPVGRLVRRAFRDGELILLDERLDVEGARPPRPRAVHYLNYGVADPDVSRPTPAAGVPSVLFLGNLYPSKGTHDVVSAIARLRDAGTRVELTVAGAPPGDEEQRDLESLIAELDVADRVHLVGPVHGEDKRSVLREATVFCFPTRYEAEGMPLVVMEAMGAGLPVVATSWRAIPSTVVEGETGFLVEPGDVEAIADRIQRIADDPELARRLGAAARRRYEDRFTLDRFRADFAAIVSGAGATRLDDPVTT